jgi:hypothetical protein
LRDHFRYKCYSGAITDKTEQLGEDNRKGLPGINSHERTAMTGLAGQVIQGRKDSQERTARIGWQNRSARMGLSEKDSLIVKIVNVSHRHRGGRIQKINAWYLNTHMVYL